MKLLMLLFFSIYLVSCKLDLANEPIIIKTPMQQFSHQGLTTSCVTCHKDQMPLEKHIDQQDCSNCHNTISWQQNTINHTTQMTNCNSCHQEQMPVEKHLASQNCSICHNVTAWNDFKINHTEAMSKCSECHVGQTPYEKHGGGSECKTCHNTTTWNTTTFIHDKSKTNCIDCHVAQKPSVEKFPLPDFEINEGHYNNKDCSACHKVSTWEFDHNNSLEQDIRFCLPCHTTRGMKALKPRPLWHAKQVKWFEGDGDCYRCHAQKKSWKRVMAKP